jgi:adenylate cyclase
MRRVGKAPSRKNPRWCELCFEKAPGGGATFTVGVLFADIRNSTALGERSTPRQLAGLLNRFYSDATKVIVQHGIVDKLIGDEVMGVYIPALTPGGRYVDALVADARQILRSAGYDRGRRPDIDIGVGLTVGPAYVGHVGDGEVRDFTAIGDAVNTAARLQTLADGGQVVMTEDVAEQAGLEPTEGERRIVELRGKSQPVAVRVLTVGP